MNILLLSVGTRNKIVQYFRRALNDGNSQGRVIATDMSEIAPAIYDADNYYIVPPITDSNYFDVILDICDKEQICAITSLIDPELEMIASMAGEFSKRGVQVICSDADICMTSLNKMKMYHWLTAHGYLTAKSYDDIERFKADFNDNKIQFPVFVKPISGSASLGITIADDFDDIDYLMKKAEGLMIQEFLAGQEIGADVYIDLITKEPVSIFTKKKLLMRAGETDKSVSFKDERLFDLIERFVKEAGYTGQIDIDIFDNDGQYYISEVNPRFGGGYPHAYEAGCDHMKLIINNLNGIANRKQIGEYEEGIFMMKYNEIKMKK